MSKLLILDSGHNERVAGKRSPDSSLLEWEFNNDMQYRIKRRAEELGISVYLTNPDPKGKDEIGLSHRSNLANKHYTSKGKPDTLFVSLHANAYGSGWTSANGTETFHAKNASANSKKAAKLINDEIVAAVGTTNRGVKSENFTVIYKVNMPAVLVEYGFYSNKKEVEILKNKRNELTEATIKGICKYFNIAYNKSTQSNDVSKSTTSTSSDFKVGSYNKNVVITASSLNVRSERNPKSAKVGSFAKGTIVGVWYIDKGTDGQLWGSCRYNNNTTGYIHLGYCNPTTQASTDSSQQIVSKSTGFNLGKFMEDVRSMIGTPYVYGGEGEVPEVCSSKNCTCHDKSKKYLGVDCSGLVYNCLKRQGINIGRSTTQMKSYNKSGKWITNKNDLQVGDICYFPGHTGVYIGDGKMIHSPKCGKTVCETSLQHYNFEKALRLNV